MKEALYYKFLPKEKTVQCLLCPHMCILSNDEIGKCLSRKNLDGKLISLDYGNISSISFDPIEKKPLYHFFPTKKILSIGSWGCNFKCGFCQNWEISQQSCSTSDTISSEQLLLVAKKESKNIGIAYTYNEPLINIEFLLETSKIFHENNLKNVLVTNGYINKKPLLDILPYIDAANIDLKSFNKNFYEKYCDGKLEFVLKTIETFVENNKHIEITTLVIPQYNDSITEIKQIINFVSSLSKDIPLHFSKYYPQYKFSVSPTEENSLITYYKLAKEKLNYVYLGNIMDEKYNSTYCPNCNKKIISRRGYITEIIGLNKNKCSYCNSEIKIIL